MSDERTLPASSRRRSETLERDGLPRSPALTTAAALLALTAWAWWRGREWFLDAAAWWQGCLLTTTFTRSPSELTAELQRMLWAGIGLAGGVVMMLFAAAATTELLQTGLRVRSSIRWASQLTTSRRLTAALSPIQILTGLMRWILPLGFLAGLMMSQRHELSGLIQEPTPVAVDLASAVVMHSLLRLTTLLLVLGVVGWSYRRWRWEQSLLMTAEEQREEQRLEHGRS